MSNEQKAKNIADSHKPCTSEFYSGIYMGALIALNKEKYSKKDLTDLGAPGYLAFTATEIANVLNAEFTANGIELEAEAIDSGNATYPDLKYRRQQHRLQSILLEPILTYLEIHS